MSTPLFSILHTSARPHAWRAVYDDWMSKAVHPENVEYVLCVDQRWGFSRDRNAWPDDFVAAVAEGTARFEWNTGRRCYVDGVNTAAKASTGRVLIVNADDQFACEHWDAKLLDCISPHGDGSQKTGRDFVIEVSTGTPDEHERGIMVMPILSRARYERLGYVFYPEYESMFADNDFCESAREAGIVIDARHLMFPHRHWINGYRWEDEQDQAQNRIEAFDLGKRLLERRRNWHFRNDQGVNTFAVATPQAGKESADCSQSKEGAIQPVDSGRVDKVDRPPVLAICTPGEVFREEFVGMLRRLDFFLQREFVVQPVMGHATEPWRIRQEMADGILSPEWQPRADFVLWIDDDNLVTVEQFQMLYRALIDLKADVVAGWCWIQYGEKEPYKFVPSFGYFNEQRNAIRYADAPTQTEIVQADFTGFPCVLMRREALERAGAWAFRPIMDEGAISGMIGEDVSFCRRLKDAGVHLHVHTGVKVPHLKTRAIEPEYLVKKRAAVVAEDTDKSATINPFPNRDDLFDLEGNRILMYREHVDRGGVNYDPNCRMCQEKDKRKKRPRIIGAMRVKNEARWIKRCIESLFPLCDAVYVMDDGSTDGTRTEARAAGGKILWSPFAGTLPLDEARDKNALLETIRDEESQPFDYILWIDGDEQLESGGAEKILTAIAENPNTPAFNLRFYYLWNDTKTVRWDRWYSRVKRPSLFKNLDGVRFKSFYEGRGVHSGLHTSNCPFDLAKDAKDLDCFLIHYGYIFRKDRIAKYEYYNRIDPKNPMEDGYRHMVIGDLFPTDSTFLHAGPLDLCSGFVEVPPLECGLDSTPPKMEEIWTDGRGNFSPYPTVTCYRRHEATFQEMAVRM